MPSTTGVVASKTAVHRLAGLAVGREARLDDDRLRAQPARLRAAHRGADAVRLGLVARGEHHPRADDHRTAAQPRVVPLLDRREERVERRRAGCSPRLARTYVRIARGPRQAARPSGTGGAVHLARVRPSPTRTGQVALAAWPLAVPRRRGRLQDEDRHALADDPRLGQPEVFLSLVSPNSRRPPPSTTGNTIGAARRRGRARSAPARAGRSRARRCRRRGAA